MSGFLGELSLSSAALSEGRRTLRSRHATPALARVFHPAVRLHLKLGQRGTKEPRPRFAHDRLVTLRVAFADVAVRDWVKQAGATWDPERRVRQLRYDRVVRST